MAIFVPILLVLAGGALCAAGERAMLDRRWYKALITGAPGVALVAMGVVAVALGLTP
ncbi:hypothetical protein OHA25_08665 [Nonomuraea sp. NBC_00507]|uniref:hypothetical protein n=1 Tax=Nonomuraea sp. NBC_00507 TaxID=2976002 RepID=UPI002E186AD7